MKGSRKKSESEEPRLVAYLSNYEVYRYLKEIKETGAGTGGISSHGAIGSADTKYPQGQGQVSSSSSLMRTPSHLPTLVYETLHYFQNSPVIYQTPEIIETLMSKLQPFDLTKPEKLMICNIRPRTPIDIQAIIEESEERLTEEQVDELIDIVKETIPIPNESQSHRASNIGSDDQGPSSSPEHVDLED